MLTATVELWPYGDQSLAKRLVTIAVANVGLDPASSEYNYVWTIDEPKPLYNDPISAQGLLVGYDRKASCVAILGAVLKSYEEDGNYEFSSQYYKDICERIRLKTKP